MAGVLWIERHKRARHQLSLEFGLDDLCFRASYWYADVDFYALEERFDREFMERIYFHIAAFTANTLVSLRPDVLDPGPYARFCTPEFWSLWRQVVRGVWAQWRFENDEPDYMGPDMVTGVASGCASKPVCIQPGEATILSFCGGGKDSLVALKLIERAGMPYDTFAYSSTIYGAAQQQHNLIDGLLNVAAGQSVARRRVWAYDDLTDSPVLQLASEYGAVSLTAAETPTSIFLALPLALQHGYTYLCLGHERSADRGNLVWERTGEEINHQWGKSHEAEVLLNGYIREQLVENCHYFSILKPTYDSLIFNLLAQDLDAVPYTHSCNIQKPWCGKCPKCAYVWISYMAYLPTDMVKSMFAAHGNLLDRAENQLWFRQMLGLEDHTPFECIGQVDEARLAFELCRRKGLDGEAMRTFVQMVPQVDVEELLKRYLQLNDSLDTLPELLRESVFSQMRAAAASALERAIRY